MQREAQRKETYSAPTRIYQKALKNKESSTVPGIGQPYEAPLDPEVRIESLALSPHEAAKKILEVIKAKVC
jgi:adenylylsulfate kinase